MIVRVKWKGMSSLYFGNDQGRFYVGAGGTGPPNVGQAPPPNIFGSNSKDTHC